MFQWLSFVVPGSFSSRTTLRVLAIACLVTLAGLASCGDVREAIGISTAPLTFGTVVDLPAPGSELSATWTPQDAGGLSTDVLTYAFNSIQWGWSANHGASWTTCNSTSATCNGSFGAFTKADSGPLANFGLFGDPTVVADKKGNVVYVTLASPGAGCPASAQGVVAILSHDGGKTFDWSTTTLVNDTSCSNGCQDQPDATFDFTTDPPTLWVAFRHNGAGPPLGIYGACARRFFIDPTNHLQPIDQAFNISSVSGSVSGAGIGAIHIRAGGGVATVVYSTTDSPARCPTTTLQSQGAASVSTYDNGITWSNNNTIVNSSTFTSCLLNQQIEVAGNSRNYDFVRAVDGTNYVVFQDTKSTIRLYMDRVFGTHPSGRGESEWREWCPGSLTGDAGSPTSNWAPRGVACTTAFYRQGQDSDAMGAGNSLAWPTLAADDQGRLAVWFYEADSTDTKVHVHFRGNVSPRAPSSVWIDQDLSTNFSPGNGIQIGNNGSAGPSRALGDYEAMTVLGGLGQPKCGSTGTYFPAWTFANGPVDASNTSNPETIDGGVVFP